MLLCWLCPESPQHSYRTWQAEQVKEASRSEEWKKQKLPDHLSPRVEDAGFLWGLTEKGERQTILSDQLPLGVNSVTLGASVTTYQCLRFKDRKFTS